MKLASLHIDRFGARKDLRLADFTDHLNVVYGPNGSGKTTIIQFLRWMLFGDRDEISRRYLNTSGGPAFGSVTIRDARGLRSLERRCQAGSMLSHLTTPGQLDGAIPPTTVSNVEFDRFFVVSFDRARNIADLINAANAHGLALHVDESKLEQSRQLRSRIDSMRQELTAFSHLESRDQLMLRRQQIESQINGYRQSTLEQLRSLQEQKASILQSLAEPQSTVDHLQNVAATLEDAIATRKRHLVDLREQWETEHRLIAEQRQERVDELSEQLHRWHQILQEVRVRLDELRNRQDTASTYRSTDPAELQLFVKQLGLKIQDIEQDLHYVQDPAERYEGRMEADYLRQILQSAMASLRTELLQIGQSVEQQRFSSRDQAAREELNYLLRVEREISDLVETLSRQRTQLSDYYAAGMDVAPRDFTFVASTPWIQSSLPNSYPSSVSRTDFASDAFGRTSKFEGSVNQLWSEYDDFRLRHLSDRRNTAAAKLSEAELRVRELQQELQRVETAIEHHQSDTRIESLQRELHSLHERLLVLDRRAELERRLADLETQYQQLADLTGSSSTVQRATAYLRQLTDGEFAQIQISQDHRCRVTSRSRVLDSRHQTPGDSFVYDYAQLSRGVQDQVYLALTLAIVEALESHGKHAPLVLNDVFSNLDQTAMRALVNVLETCSHKQQILVFTRHDHIRELFQRTQARLFTLREDRPLPSLPALRTKPRPEPRPSLDLSTPPVRPQQPTYDSATEPTPPPTPSYKWVAEWQDRSAPVGNRVDRYDPPPIFERRYPSLATTTARRTPEPELSPLPEYVPVEAEPELNPEPVVTEVVPSISLTTALHEAPLLGDEFVSYMRRLKVTTVGEFFDLDPEFAASELEGFGVTLEIVQRRQRELLMIVYVGANELEAQLLVAAGVPDPARLARADEAVLLKRMETILSRPQAADRFGSVTRYSLSRIRTWIRNAQSSSFQARSRRSVSRSGRGRSERTRRRSEATAAPRLHVAADTDLRFYLELSDPVVDAPSIGPKTAEKLHAVGILTVADLLQTEAADISASLDEKRFTAELIRQWQLQAELVCTVPNLRGHDAQILVGSGVEDAVTLSSLEPSSLLPRVTKFVESKAGQRAIRNAKKPDLAEVTAWIAWSESARELQAA